MLLRQGRPSTYDEATPGPKSSVGHLLANCITADVQSLVDRYLLVGHVLACRYLRVHPTNSLGSIQDTASELVVHVFTERRHARLRS